MNPPALPRLLGALCLSLAAVGCGDDGERDDAPPTLAERVEALGACTPTDLTMILPWTGPAFDPETGELRAPLPDGYVEAVVNGWVRTDDRAVALRLEHGAATADDVFGREGLLGFQGYESTECNIAASHTLWRDEASMYAFVTGEAHARAMADTHQMHHVGAGAHWRGAARSTAPTWREGIDRYVQEVLARER